MRLIVTVFLANQLDLFANMVLIKILFLNKSVGTTAKLSTSPSSVFFSLHVSLKKRNPLPLNHPRAYDV